MLYTAYNQEGHTLAYACRIGEDLGDGQYIVHTGSARLIASSVKVLEVGDVLDHWRYGKVEVQKINRKTVKIVYRNSGDRAPDLVV